MDENSEMEEIFHKRLSEYYHLYLIIGGMPECVASWIAHHDYAKVELIQEELLLLYESDITKHNKKVNAAKVLLVYRNLVTQLAKENKKFVYGVLKPGASASGEIDFVIQHHDCVIPIEVKSAQPTKSTSFRNYLKKYSPEQAIKFTKLPPKKNETVFNLPLYLAGKLP